MQGALQQYSIWSQLLRGTKRPKEYRGNGSKIGRMNGTDETKMRTRLRKTKMEMETRAAKSTATTSRLVQQQLGFSFAQHGSAPRAGHISIAIQPQVCI